MKFYQFSQEFLSESDISLFHLPYLMSGKLHIDGFDRIESVEESPRLARNSQPMYYRERQPHKGSNVPLPKISVTTTESKPLMDYLKPPLRRFGPSFQSSFEQAIKCNRKKVNRNVEVQLNISIVYNQLKKYWKKDKQAKLKQKSNDSDYLYLDRKKAQELNQYEHEIKRVRSEQASLLHLLKYTHRNDQVVEKQNELAKLNQQLQNLLNQQNSLQKITKSQNTSLNQMQSRGNLSMLMTKVKEELASIQKFFRQEKHRTQQLRRQIMHLTISNSTPSKRTKSIQQQKGKLQISQKQNIPASLNQSLNPITQSLRDQNDITAEKDQNIDQELQKLRKIEQQKRKLLFSKQNEVKQCSRRNSQLKKTIQKQIKGTTTLEPRLSQKSNLSEYRTRKVPRHHP